MQDNWSIEKWVTIIVISAIAMVGCTYNSTTVSRGAPQDGGQHGGGGKTTRSTPEQVRTAIELAYSYATNKDLRINPFVRFWLDDNSHDDSLSNSRRLFPRPNFFPNMPPKSERRDNWYTAKNFYSPVLNALAEKRIEFREKGDCPSPDHKHADASVSEFTLNATICFSLENLKQIPEGELLGSLLELIYHESVHMLGMEEDAAQYWQDEFHWYFRTYVQKGVGFGRDFSNVGFFNTETETLEQAEELLANDNLSGAYSILGSFRDRVLATSPDSYLDPLILNLNLMPYEAWRVNNFTNSFLALTEIVRESLNPEAMPDAQSLPAIIAKLKDTRDAVSANFWAYQMGTKSLRPLEGLEMPEPACILPKGEPERVESHQLFLVPPRECAKPPTED